MANEQQTQGPPDAAPAQNVKPADKAAKDAARQAKKKARQELRALHGKERAADFDHARYHELHYLAAGKPVPSTDPDDLD
jgi:hypothetical protein